MAIHRLSLDEFDEVDYKLIAIHSALEDYRLAYFLNQKLPVILSKSKEDEIVKFQEDEIFLSKYIFNDKKNDTNWTLIQNKNDFISNKQNTNQNLFFESNLQIQTKVYLLPEYKKVDYFLKIENGTTYNDIKETIKKINTITRISTIYEIDVNQIKSKNNLIF